MNRPIGVLTLLGVVWGAAALLTACGPENGPVASNGKNPAPAAAGTPDNPTSTPSGSPSFTLDLPAQDPDDQGSCRAGHYSGSFLGRYTSGATLIGIPIEVTGDVDLRLNQEPIDREFLAIQNGHVKGTADRSFPYECDMRGMLNCGTKKLENGFIECTYRVLISSYKFSGPVAAEFNPLDEALENGTWSGKEPNMLPNMGGSGTWNARWDGP